MKVKPYLDYQTLGVFSTRAPARPNPIGISAVQLVKIEGNLLRVQNFDNMDGTSFLVIKPFIPEFDIRDVTKKEWLEKNVSKLSTSKDNG